MKTEFEADLSEAFAARAAAVPIAAASRLRSMDYRPRERRLRAPVTVGAGVLASAGTAGAVLSVVLGGAAPAYAGWSAAPTIPSSSSSPSAAASCQSRLTTTPSGPGGSGLGSGPWENVLTDVRGPFTVALFQNDGAYASCFTSSSFTQVSMVSSGGSSGSAAGSAGSSASLGASTHAGSGGGPGGGGSAGMSSVSLGGGTASGDLTQATQSHLSTTSDGPYTLVDGRVGPGVTGVTLVLDDGQDVVTTVADGWFVAWWPDSAGATSAQVTSASGMTTESLVWLHGSPGGLPAPGGSGNTGNSGSSGSSGNSGNS
jgi:hypothetical protein